MRPHKIYGIILRYLFLLPRSYDRLNDVFLWPSIELVLWGLTGTFLQKFTPEGYQIVVMIISGILFWLIVTRGQFEVSLNLLEDLWNNNLINIFVSPIKFWEWISAFLILGIVKSIFSFVFASLIAYFLYRENIFMFGFYLLPFIMLLLMTGWWIGFFMAGLILRYGTRIQTIAWSTTAILAPFSAIYYPLSILPVWAQKIALLIPTSYIFEGMREVINTGKLDTTKLIISFVLNIIYLILSLIFIRRSFNAVLKRGLISVD